MLLFPHQEQIKLPPCKWAHTTAIFQSPCKITGWLSLWDVSTLGIYY